MKIGVSGFAWTTTITPAYTALFPRLLEHGISGFEIPMFVPSDLAASQLRKALDAGNLDYTVCAILPPGINPISSELSIRAQSLAHLIQCIKTSAELGAHLLGGPLFAPIGYLPGRRRNQDEWNWAVECFQALTVFLDEYEMTLSIEPVNRSETFFMNTAAEAKAFCEAIDHPRVGVTIDTFHANIVEKNIAAAVASLGPHLKHLHVSENDRGLLGSGHVDFPAIVTALHQINYDGYLMIEGFGYSPNEPNSLGALWGELTVSPEDIAFQGANYLRKLLASCP
jgi:D-psicose/D-tagatose/L-ribulose 3-epimerase